MERFSDCEQYNQIVKAFRATHKKLVTNNYLMFSEVEKLIFEHRLFYLEFSDTLLILRDEVAYWNVSFFSERTVAEKRIELDKPCVTEIVNKGVELTERNRTLENVVIALGFQYSCLNRQYEYDLTGKAENIQEQIDGLAETIESFHLKCIPFNSAYTEEIHALWIKTLNRDNIPKEDWEDHIHNCVMVVDTENQNALCGVYMPKIESNKYSIWHLAVDPSYRNRKIAYYLTMCLMKKALDDGYEKVYNWIADDNLPSLCLHQLFDSKKTENVSYQYKL